MGGRKTGCVRGGLARGAEGVSAGLTDGGRSGDGAELLVAGWDVPAAGDGSGVGGPGAADARPAVPARTPHATSTTVGRTPRTPTAVSVRALNPFV
ncbi:MAG TPA: hypothetical protein VK132_09970 [Gemmatimonadales bacterium]|nr:hypothetical protein [Gemmatimonadales bacterium]